MIIGAISTAGATALLIHFIKAVAEIAKAPQYTSSDLYQEILKHVPTIFLCIWLELSIIFSIFNFGFIVTIKDKKNNFLQK